MMCPLLCHMDFLMYLSSQQKQQLIDLPLLYGVDFSFFFFSFLSSFFLFSLFGSKIYIVKIVPYTIWIVRDKARYRLLYCALLTRYLDIMYIDLLSKILDGISVFSSVFF